MPPKLTCAGWLLRCLRLLLLLLLLLLSWRCETCRRHFQYSHQSHSLVYVSRALFCNEILQDNIFEATTCFPAAHALLKLLKPTRLHLADGHAWCAAAPALPALPAHQAS